MNRIVGANVPIDTSVTRKGELDELASRFDRRPYEAPQLRALGTFAELTRGTTGSSDGMMPGSALP